MKVSKKEFIALRKAISLLAYYDSDRAAYRNGRGFNKRDSKTGHRLANKDKWNSFDVVKALKLARRYYKQLPPEIKENLPKHLAY